LGAVDSTTSSHKYLTDKKCKPAQNDFASAASIATKKQPPRSATKQANGFQRRNTVVSSKYALTTIEQ